jgi:hypothetical protein
VSVSGTLSDILTRMVDLAAELEARGDTIGAADVRGDIRTLTTPRPRARVYCDACRTLVTSERQAAKYDALGVDWLLCRKCEVSTA